MRLVLLVLAVAVLLVASPLLLVGLGLWAADGSWDFDGTRNIRYWLLVKGSRLERLDFVEAAGPVHFSVSLQDGNFPGWSIASFESAASPAAVIDFYAGRCGAMAFRITERTEPQAESDAGRLTCEIEPYLDVEIAAERAASAATTVVGIKVWGRE